MRSGVRFIKLLFTQKNRGITKSIKKEVIPMGNFDSA